MIKDLFDPGHLAVLVIVLVVLFFGWKQLPDMARSAGRSLRIFKTEVKALNTDDEAKGKAGETTAAKSEADVATKAEAKADSASSSTD
ncbi:MAG: Sec-independent protein translocase subunit TatA [Actinomycetia bacterium]|nr:Sec-independent protein translocase subunit TatA [Actinomycetes bacterium]